MNRKSFLQAMAPATLGVLLNKRAAAATPNTKAVVPSGVPPYLKQGDTIAITCPANCVDTADLRSCAKVFENWGINIKYGKTVGKKWLRYAGTDEERLNDLQELLDDDTVNAVLFGRGGYGTMRILDKINWKRFKERPKWLIGYSDITAIHLHVHAMLGTPTIHGDMSIELSAKPNHPSTKSLEDILFGKPVAYMVKGHKLNREGNCKGTLVGGNLSLIQACSGSESDISTDGKILLIEDVHEYKYVIDRMLVHLKRSGKLEKLSGLIVGGFTVIKEKEEEEYRQTIEELVWEKVRDYDYPVCFNFPAGHIKNNLALKLGVQYELSVSLTDVILNEKLSS